MFLLSTLSFLLEFKVSHDRSVSSLELVKSNCNTPWRHFVSKKKKESWNQAKKSQADAGWETKVFSMLIYILCVWSSYGQIANPNSHSNQKKFQIEVRERCRSMICSCVTLRILIAAARQDRHHHKNAKASAKKFSVKRRIKLFGTMIFPVANATSKAPNQINDTLHWRRKFGYLHAIHPKGSQEKRCWELRRNKKRNLAVYSLRESWIPI